MRYLLLLLVFFCDDAAAQKNYRIEYLMLGKLDFTINGQPQQSNNRFVLLYNDTLSFFYVKPQYGDKFKKAKVLGNKLDHHAIMYNKNTDELLYEVALSRKKYYAVIDTPNYFKWSYTSEIKNILGYNCNAAYTVSPENDTIVLWYTNQLGNYFGPMRYFGVPGIVLEALDPAYKNHLLAAKVEESSTILVQPEVKKIAMKEYLKKKVKG